MRIDTTVASFEPSKSNLYTAVKEIFHPATNAGVTADDTNNELDVSGGGSSAEFSGALVGFGRAYSKAAGEVNIPWQGASYNIGNWWSSGRPDQFIVPAGVSRVRLYGSVVSNNSVTCNLIFYKNGEKFAGSSLSGSSTGQVSISSPPIVVEAGDTFELAAWTMAAQTLSLDSYFAIEKVS